MYGRYRPWLRDEFCFRCVYCLRREKWTPVRGEFHLDHFAPQSINPNSALEYDNLVYSCCSCNIGKGDEIIPDPTSALVSTTVVVDEDGRINGMTQEAKRLIAILDLNHADYREFRSLFVGIVAMARSQPAVYGRFMGFPDDLPNLRQLRPKKNTRPQGISESFAEQAKRGDLPMTY